jgi:CTP synthase (UTP-ammonia lyase)
MTTAIRIGLIGDYDAAVPAHQAIPRALDLAGEAAAASVSLRMGSHSGDWG